MYWVSQCPGLLQPVAPKRRKRSRELKEWAPGTPGAASYYEHEQQAKR